MTRSRENVDDVTLDDGLGSLAWTESREEDYLKQILKEQEALSKKEDAQRGPLDPPGFLSGVSTGTVDSKRSSSQTKIVNDDEYTDDGLPNAIKLMDEISVGTTPKSSSSSPQPPSVAAKQGILEKMFNYAGPSSTSKPKIPQTPTSSKHPILDALAFEQVSVGDDDLTVNQMIQEMEKQEEEELFGIGETNLNDNGKRSKGQSKNQSSQYGPSTLSPIRKSLLPAMNAGLDEKCTNESLAGNSTVDDIILKMESEDMERDEMLDHLEDGTIRTWTNFNPIAGSVVSQADNDVDHTTQSRLTRDATPHGGIGASDIGKRPATPRRISSTTSKKNRFVDDDTSVGSFTPEMEVVVKKRRSRNYDRENDAATTTSYGNQNTLVSSLSHDETYYRLGQQPPGALPTTEENPWWVAAERNQQSGKASAQDKSDSSKDTPSPPTSETGKLPLTPSTHNSEYYFDLSSSPLARSTNVGQVGERKRSSNTDTSICEAMKQSLRDNKVVRCLVLLSALCFAAFVALGVLMLLEEQGQGQEGAEDPIDVQSTPPPFEVVLGGANVTFEYNGTNATSTPYVPSENATSNVTSSPSFSLIETSSPSIAAISNEIETMEPSFSDSLDSQQSQPPSADPTMSATADSTDQEDTSVPELTLPPSSDSSSNVPASTQSPTLSNFLPSFPSDDYTGILLEIIRQRLPVTFEKLGDPSSPQYRALQWIVASQPEPELLSQPSRIVQRWVLAVVFYSTKGEEWVNSSGWLTESNECSWYSSSSDRTPCGDDGLIYEIELRRNGLSGTLPEELLLLADNIESIRVNGNSITGSIPNFLSDMSKLGRLHLNGNLMTGTIPASLGKLFSTLWSLRLGQMSLAGSLPPQLGALTRLEYLYLANNRFVGTIPAQLGNLSQLLELELYDNQLTGTVPKELSTMASLSSLELDRNLLGGSVDPAICIALGAPEDTTIKVDCNEVSCSCCKGC